jgi:integrase
MPAKVARKLAQAVLIMLADGKNPNEVRRARVSSEVEVEANRQARSITLQAAVEQYGQLKSFKASTLRDQASVLSRNFSDWMRLPLADITREMVLQRFQAIQKRVSDRRLEVAKRWIKEGKEPKEYVNDHGRGEAQKAFRYLSAIINSFMNDLVGGEPLLSHNPCMVLKDKKVRKVLQPKDRYLNNSEINQLVDLFGHVHHSDYRGKVGRSEADFVTLLLMTGFRSDEARTMRWDYVDHASKLFEVKDTKNHTSHRLPMTSATERLFARALSRRKGEHPFVFPSPRAGLNPASMSRVFDRVTAEVGFNFSAHDLRRTAATTASDLGFDIAKIGALLNHKKQNVTMGYIQSTIDAQRGILQAIEDAILHFDDPSEGLGEADASLMFDSKEAV